MRELRAPGLQALDRFCQTLEHWLHKIATYFERCASNRRTEGFNTGLRASLWRALNLVNFAHFRLRALDCFGHPAL